MHKYLRAIGFSNLKTRRELKKILNDVLKNPTEKQYVSLEDDSIAVEYRKEFADSIGITVCGAYSDEIEFDYEFYYPYFIGSNVSSTEDISVERHAEKDSYAGICDDLKVGVTLIFYLQNRMDYIKRINRSNSPIPHTSVNLSGFSVNGSIMLPLKKNPQQEMAVKQVEKNRNDLLAAARNGDEDAIEDLTMDDIDTYNAISRKIRNEDVYSLVDTYFMPYGIECDHYSVLGEIEEVRNAENSVTKEKIYIITLNCNDLIFDICINKKDLIGEPAVHRRFKGIIWLQGHINF
ncbi:protein of unknown function [Lachnospiraceae bacterium]|nr:protein of unknown function [Lachnospiraceae bacterium]